MTDAVGARGVSLEVVQQAWDEAQEFLKPGMAARMIIEATGHGESIDGFETNFGSHVRAAAATMGFLNPRPAYDGLNDRENGSLWQEELFCRFIERSYGDVGRRVADDWRRSDASMREERMFPLLELFALPGWIHTLAYILDEIAQPLGPFPHPAAALDDFFYLSPFRVLISTQTELIARGVPADRVDEVRIAKTGLARNMQTKIARTLGLWGGVCTLKQISSRTHLPLSAVQSYKKKNERGRPNGRRPLKTADGSFRRTQVELAFLVGHDRAGHDVTEVCADLGILRIEHKLYDALWDQICGRMDVKPESLAALLEAAGEVVEEGALHVGLPREHWGEIGDEAIANAIDEAETEVDGVVKPAGDKAIADEMKCYNCGAVISTTTHGYELCQPCYEETMVG